MAGFAALVLLHGMLVAALAARISRSVPLLGTRPAALGAHAPLLVALVTLPGFVSDMADTLERP